MNVGNHTRRDNRAGSGGVKRGFSRSSNGLRNWVHQQKANNRGGKMKDKTIIKMWAMSLIGILEVVNLAVFHTDGAVLAGTIAAIGGIAGYTIAKVKGEK